MKGSKGARRPGRKLLRISVARRVPIYASLSRPFFRLRTVMYGLLLTRRRPTLRYSKPRDFHSACVAKNRQPLLALSLEINPCSFVGIFTAPRRRSSPSKQCSTAATLCSILTAEKSCTVTSPPTSTGRWVGIALSSPPPRFPWRLTVCGRTVDDLSIPIHQPDLEESTSVV